MKSTLLDWSGRIDWRYHAGEFVTTLIIAFVIVAVLWP